MIRSPLSRVALTLGIPGFLTCVAHAGDVWDGGGPDGKWSTAANWDADTVPTAATLLQFGGSSQTDSSNDLFATGTSSGGFQFNAGAGPFVITGNGLSIAGNITNNSTNPQTINLPLNIAGTTSINATSGPITLGGAINGGMLVKNGSYPLTLGNATNAYSGAITVNGGNLNVLGTLPNGLSITVNVGGTLAGTGTINRGVTVSGNVYPGVNGVGTLTTGRVAQPPAPGNTTITGQLTATGSNKLMVNGNLVFGDPSLNKYATTLNIDDSVVTTTPLVIAEYTGTVTGTLNSILTHIVEYHGGANGKQVTVMRPDDGYWYWAYGKGLTLANLGLDEDPDQDGFPNLMEFILGGNPLVRSGNLAPTLTADAQNFVFHFTRPDDAKYGGLHPTVLKAQWSTDLSQWNDIIIPDNISGSGPVTVVRTTVDYVSVAIPRSNAANGRMFIRLAATRTL